MNFESKKKNSLLYLLLVMGGLAAFGPFVTDFYLPALPTLHNYFNTSESIVQLSLSCSLMGLAFGQLLLGPLSDKFGRKKILLFSLTLFILSTIWCLLTTNIISFIIARLIQGIAGAGGIVISKSVATDSYSGEDLAKFFAMLGAVQGLAPIFAPIFGGILLQFLSWKWIFAILLSIGVALLIAVFFFKESLQIKNDKSILESFAFIKILTNKKFMRFALIQSLAMGAMFSFIASSSFIFQGYYELSSLYYSFCFAGVAFCVTIGAAISPTFNDEKKALKVGVMGIFVMGIIVFLALNIRTSAYIVELCFAGLTFFIGLILPTSTTLAMEMEHEHAGSASAVIGFGAFMVGGIVSPLTTLGNNIMLSTSLTIISCCVLVTLIFCKKAK